MIVLNCADLLQKYAYFLALMKVSVSVQYILLQFNESVRCHSPFIPHFSRIRDEGKKMTGIYTYQESKKISLQKTLQSVLQAAVQAVL
jgi:hypothetical protein